MLLFRCKVTLTCFVVVYAIGYRSIFAPRVVGGGANSRGSISFHRSCSFHTITTERRPELGSLPCLVPAALLPSLPHGENWRRQTDFPEWNAAASASSRVVVVRCVTAFDVNVGGAKLKPLQAISTPGRPPFPSPRLKRVLLKVGSKPSGLGVVVRGIAAGGWCEDPSIYTTGSRTKPPSAPLVPG